ncbi:MAG: sulfite reductase subunit A, partial [Chloroflexota bacterium]
MTGLNPKHYILERENLQGLFNVLTESGYHVIAPTVGEGAVIYDEVDTADDLPVGWRDEQTNGTYRLEKEDSETVFGYTLSPQSWRRYLSPPEVKLWQAHRTNGSFTVESNDDPPPRYAFIGVRACELHAIQIQDRVFMQGDFVDPTYKARREGLFIVAVNCGRAGNTCFCTSTNTGPEATDGFDLAMTEVSIPDRHFFSR